MRTHFAISNGLPNLPDAGKDHCPAATENARSPSSILPASSESSIALSHFGKCARMFIVSECGRLGVLFPPCSWGSSIRFFTEHMLAITAATHFSRATKSSTALRQLRRGRPVSRCAGGSVQPGDGTATENHYQLKVMPSGRTRLVLWSTWKVEAGPAAPRSRGRAARRWLR